MTSFKISTEKAKQNKLFYVVANLIIIKASYKSFLLLQRGHNEDVLPDKWSFPGGKLEHKDVEEWITAAKAKPISGVDNVLGLLAVREAKEECGLEVSSESKLVRNKVFIRPDGIPVFMATLATEYAGGEVVIEDGAIQGYAWVTIDKLDRYDCVPELGKEAREALGMFK